MSALGLAALVTGGLMAGCWLVSLPKRDVSIVDPLWPMVFVAAAWSLWLWSDGAGGNRAWLMLVMVSAWGLRLGAHLTARKWGAPEDFRYQALRRRLEPFWLWSLPVVFILQAGLAVVVSLPVQAVLDDPDPSPLRWLDWVGASVWAVGLTFEAVADEQLRRFKADDAGRGGVMDRGLWRYSRHPNYFGDSTAWWGIWLVAAAAGAWWTVAGPLLMTILLLKGLGGDRAGAQHGQAPPRLRRVCVPHQRLRPDASPAHSSLARIQTSGSRGRRGPLRRLDPRRADGVVRGGLGVQEPALDGRIDLTGLVQRGNQRGQLQVDLVDERRQARRRRSRRRRLRGVTHRRRYGGRRDPGVDRGPGCRTEQTRSPHQAETPTNGLNETR